MIDILLLKFFHLLCFVYWLGADLGVFYSSNYLIKKDISVESRRIAARIMSWLDQVPRISMALMLPTGIHLSAAMGYITLSTTGRILLWLICLAWLANIIILYVLNKQSLKHRMEAIDFCFRIFLVLGLGGISIYALLTDRLIPPDWLAVKLLIFALLVACGLAIRIFIRPFTVAFANMVREGRTDAGDVIMANSIRRCRYVVIGLWLGLLVNAAIGIHLINV